MWAKFSSILTSNLNQFRRHRSTSSREYQRLMYILESKVLLKQTRLVEVAEAFEGTKVIAYYFSAAWCTPCREFMPKMIPVYEKGKRENRGLEVIFVSSDNTPDEGFRYYLERHGNWYAIPMVDPAAQILGQIYSLDFIPQVIVVDTDSQVISRNGMADVKKYESKVLDLWIQ